MMSQILYEVRLQQLPATLEDISIVSDRPVLPGAPLTSVGPAEVPTTPLPGLSAGLATGQNRLLPRILLDPAPLIPDPVHLPEAPRAADIADSVPERPTPVSVASPATNRGDTTADEPLRSSPPTARASPTLTSTALVAVDTEQVRVRGAVPAAGGCAPQRSSSHASSSTSPAPAPTEEKTGSGGVDEAVFTPELIAATPPSLIDGCRTAIQLDAASKTDEALQCCTDLDTPFTWNPRVQLAPLAHGAAPLIAKHALPIATRPPQRTGWLTRSCFPGGRLRSQTSPSSTRCSPTSG